MDCSGHTFGHILRLVDCSQGNSYQPAVGGTSVYYCFSYTGILLSTCWFYLLCYLLLFSTRFRQTYRWPTVWSWAGWLAGAYLVRHPFPSERKIQVQAFEYRPGMAGSSMVRYNSTGDSQP